jgi:hypothetical protein
MLRTAFAVAFVSLFFACIATPSRATPHPSGVAIAQIDHPTQVGCRRYRRNGVWGCW